MFTPNGPTEVPGSTAPEQPPPVEVVEVVEVVGIRLAGWSSWVVFRPRRRWAHVCDVLDFLQPGVGSAGGASGRLPACVDAASSRRGGRRVPEDARGRAADQAGHTRPVRASRAGELLPQTHLQIGPVMQGITMLFRSDDGELPDFGHRIEHQSG